MWSTFISIILQLLFCYDFGASSENFEIKTENLNKRLVPYTFLEKVVRTHHDCVRECFHFGGQCKTINYNLRNRTCELKSKGSVDAVDVLEYEHVAGYVFTDITDWPTLTLSECPDHSCHEKQNCLPHGNSDYQCVDKVDCGPAPAIEFSTVTALVTTEGAVATYSCDFGYELNGSISEVTCKDGSWTADGHIACNPKDCGPLTDIHYVKKKLNATTHGGIATYSCFFGYQHTTGDLTRTCVDGKWDGIEPSCIIKDCGPPAVVEHGSVSTLLTTHGQYAWYSCDSEYEITSGSQTRTCWDGAWDGILPVCSAIPNVGCYISGQSEVYEGTRQTTINGVTCQRWDTQSPHVPEFVPLPDTSAHANFCRDPDITGEPWCYTTDPDIRWEICGIPKC